MTARPEDGFPPGPEDAGPSYRRVEGPDGRVLVVSGELDLATADELRQQLDAAIDGCGSDLRVDLSGVTFFDSSSVAVLIEASRRASTHGRTLTVVRPSPECRRVLEILGLGDVLDVRDESTR